MLNKSTERILRRMDRMGFAGAGEALREIERLRDVIDRAAQAWLSLDPPVQWEGDVGDAMVAAVAEIERLRAYKTEIEHWTDIGERMIEPAAHWGPGGNVMVQTSMMFKLGAWWADRPWRVREAPGE